MALKRLVFTSAVIVGVTWAVAAVKEFASAWLVFALVVTVGMPALALWTAKSRRDSERTEHLPTQILIDVIWLTWAWGIAAEQGFSTLWLMLAILSSFAFAFLVVRDVSERSR